MIAFYALTAIIYFVPWSVMRDNQEWLKDEATPRLARVADASFLIPQHSLAKACPERSEGSQPSQGFCRNLM